MRKLLLLLALSSCYFSQVPENTVTSDSAEAGTYKMFADIGQGTAWAINHHTLVTAGHMCESMKADSVLVSSNERRIRARSITWETSDSNFVHDLCILVTDSYLPSPLILADRMPFIGEKVEYVGYPQGSFKHGVGIYLGDTDGPDRHYDDYTFSCPDDHGASGSALYMDHGVWGVLVRLIVDVNDNVLDGTHGGVAIPLDKIKAILNENDIEYTTYAEVKSVFPND